MIQQTKSKAFCVFTTPSIQAAQGARGTRLLRGFGPHRLRCGLGRLGWWSDAALGTIQLGILLKVGVRGNEPSKPWCFKIIDPALKDG